MKVVEGELTSLVILARLFLCQSVSTSGEGRCGGGHVASNREALQVTLALMLACAEVSLAEPITVV